MPLDDTSPDARRTLNAMFRRMSYAEKLALMDELTLFAHALTRAGIRERMPDASEEELEAEYFAVVLGRDLAEKVLAHRARVRITRAGSPPPPAGK